MKVKSPLLDAGIYLLFLALAGYMQRDLVERRKWLASQDYREGLALAQLAPGPLAAQLE